MREGRRSLLPWLPERRAPLAAEAGLDPGELLACANSERSLERQGEILAGARAAGAFGVPTFVTPDGALFFGQDRLPLLRAHLA